MTIPGALQGLQIVKPLGADRAVLVASDQSSGSRQLVVVERVTRASPVPAARTELLRRGRALKLLEHPKVTKVRDVFERDGDVVVVSNYVDGEWLASLMTMEPRPPPEVMIRLIVDVLEGLGALHDLRDERDQPIGFVHGGIAPDTILVADDGVAEIARTCRLPRPGSNERYVPPELWRGDTAAEPRCDIYAVGAILRDVLADAPAGAKWAEPLTEIAWRACAVEPEERWPSAAAMATTVRRIAGLRMANASAVADFVRRHFGPAIRARRVALESKEESVPPSSGEPISLAEVELVEPSSSSVATLPRSTIKKDVPVARVSLVKRPLLALPADDSEPAKPSQPPHPPPTKTTQMGLAPPPAPLPAPAPKIVASAAPPAASQPSSPPKVASPQPPPVAPKVSSPPSLAPDTVSPAILVSPTITVNAATAPPPPPTIVPEEPDPTAEYRRRLPTFPTFEDTPPAKDKNGLVAMLVAGAMVVTFGLGWWLGKSSTPTEPAQAIPTLNPSSTPSPSAPTSTASPGGLAAATETPSPSSPPSASVAVASTSPSTAASAPAATASTSTGAATLTTATSTSAWAPVATAATSPTATVGTIAASPRPTAAPLPSATTATATATTLAPRPPTTATATTTATTSPPPRPTSTSGGYVPSEL